MRDKAGLLLGAWLVANVAIYRLLVGSGWPSGSEAPDQIRVDVFEALSPVLRIAVIGLLFLVPAALVPLWRSVERSTGVDAVTVAAACRWCLQALTRPMSIAIVAGVVVLLLLPALHDTLWFIAIPAIAFLVLLPLAIFDTRVAASAAGGNWWRLRWPGLEPLLALLMLLVLSTVVELAVAAFVSSVPSLAWLGVVVAAILGAVAVTIQGAILLFRLPPPEAIRRARSILAWTRLGPIIAVHARLVFASMFLFAPVVTGALLIWKLLPFHAAWAESRGAELPRLARLLTSVGTAFETSGGWIASFVLGLALFLSVSRILWLTRDSTEEAFGA
jgi:hypothetical protein